MRIVSEEEYNQLEKQRKPIDFAQNHFLDDKGNQVSDLLQSDIPEDIKLQMYSSLMKGFSSKLKDMIEKPISVKLSVDKKQKTIEDSNKLEESESAIPSSINSTPVSSPEKTTLGKKDITFIKDMPLTLNTKAYNIMGFLKCHPELIKWGKDGRVTFWGNEFEPNSNIGDLMSYSLRDLKWTKNPPGINRFIRVLKMLNLPATNFSTKVRSDLLGSLDTISLRDNVTKSGEKMSSFKNWTPMSNKDTVIQSPDQFTTPSQTPARPKSFKDITSRKERK